MFKNWLSDIKCAYYQNISDIHLNNNIAYQANDAALSPTIIAESALLYFSIKVATFVK